SSVPQIGFLYCKMLSAESCFDANPNLCLPKTLTLAITNLVLRLWFLEGKALRSDDLLQNLPVGTSATLYFRDLGPQLGWTMVFLAEYIGPLLIYLLFYFRVPYIYNHKYTFTSSSHHVVNLACACHSFHYSKRLFETIFVHRFSNGTMPLRAIVRNCAYYWGFAAWLAYYINHPLYTPPSYGEMQVNYALIIFVLCEAGNFSIHWSLNSIKCEGAKCSRFPNPSKNPFTWLFFFVSCPNYTYEVGAWVGLSIMTQCVPGEQLPSNFVILIYLIYTV
uniref:Very-long-chain enoyl-CoA reductase-like n=1 Tax=Sinocyclocheilus grahami TaxID=75366 RepID=A0A672SE07_SINGR